jgi:hypothetical protein
LQLSLLEVVMRAIAMSVLAVAAFVAPAFAQIPAGPGQLPGTLPSAPPVVHPPPAAPPPPVPSVVRPLPSPSYGIPPGVTRAPSYGSRGTVTVRTVYPPRKKKRSKPRFYRGSMLPLHLA